MRQRGLTQLTDIVDTCVRTDQRYPPWIQIQTVQAHGRYVLFYNERLIGANYPAEYDSSNVITELCEFTVTGNLVYLYFE